MRRSQANSGTIFESKPVLSRPCPCSGRNKCCQHNLFCATAIKKSHVTVCSIFQLTHSSLIIGIMIYTSSLIECAVLSTWYYMPLLSHSHQLSSSSKAKVHSNLFSAMSDGEFSHVPAASHNFFLFACVTSQHIFAIVYTESSTSHSYLLPHITQHTERYL